MKIPAIIIPAPWLFPIAAGMIAMAALPPIAAANTYNVNVNTSSVSGTSGFLDFQFDTGNGSSQAATAIIRAFTGGTFTGSPSITGTVIGTLPATTTLTNSTPLNEYFVGFQFGSAFSFALDLSGPAVTSPNGTSTAGSTFGIGIYDAGENPILTNQTSTTGYAGLIDILLSGATRPTAFPNGTGPSVVTFTAVVPEPATIALIGAGLAGLTVVRRRSRRAT